MIIGDYLDEDEKRKIFYKNRNKFYRILVSHSVTKETRYGIGFFISDSGLLRVNLGFLTCYSDKPIQAELEIEPGRTIPLTNVIYHSYSENYILFSVDQSVLTIQKPIIANEQPCEGDEVCLLYYHEETGKLKYLWTNIHFYRYQKELNISLYKIKINQEINYAYGYLVLNEEGKLCGTELFSNERSQFGHESLFCNVTRSNYSLDNPEKLYNMSLMNFFDSWQFLVYQALLSISDSFNNNEKCLNNLFNVIQENPNERLIYTYFLFVVLFTNNNELTLEIFQYWIDKLGSSIEIRKNMFTAMDSINVNNRFELKTYLLDDLILDYPEDLEILNYKMRLLSADKSFEEASNLLVRMNSISRNNIHTLDGKLILIQALKQEESEFLEFEKDLLKHLNQKLGNSKEKEVLILLLIDYMLYCEDNGREWDLTLNIFLKFLDQYPESINLWDYLSYCKLTEQNKKDILVVYRKNSDKVFPNARLYSLLAKITMYHDEGYNQYYYYNKSLFLELNERVIEDLMIDWFIDSCYDKSFDLAVYLESSENESIRGRSFFVKACYYHVKKNYDKRDEMHRYLETNYPDEAINFGNFISKYIEE
jgi:hypothetical protein